MPGPAALESMVKMPRLLATTVIGAVARALPLYVAVMVPAPVGAFEGSSAATWLADVYYIGAFTVAPPPATVTDMLLSAVD